MNMLNKKELMESYYQDGVLVDKRRQEISLNPLKYNIELLFKILSDNKNTEFGIKHNFKDIKSLDDFRENVPLTTYKNYVKYIDRMVGYGETNLITSYPITIFAKTSGTTGHPKKIPSTVESAKICGKYMFSLKNKLIVDKIGKDWFDGKIIFAIERYFTQLPCGKLYGSISGTLIKAYGENYLDYFTSPEEVFNYDGSSDLSYMTARFALQEKDVKEIISTFASRTLELFEYIVKNWKILVEDIRNGQINSEIKLNPQTRESLIRKIKPLPTRANELEEIFTTKSRIVLAKRLWPNLAYIQTIATTTFEPYFNELKKYIGDLNLFNIGIMASEGLFTFPIELNSTNCIPSPDFMFYEFLPYGKKISRITLTIDELKLNEKYEIVTTNLNGFYRYKMGDIVKVIGFYNKLPILEFSHRKNQHINICGEKTNDFMISNALDKILKKYNIKIVDYSIFEDRSKKGFNYGLFIEYFANHKYKNLSKEIDQKLQENNPSYKKYRDNGQLQQLRIYSLQKETYSLYKDIKIYSGISRAQCKPPHILSSKKDIRFFSALINKKER